MNEIRNLTVTELHRQLAESRDELRELRGRVSGRQLAQVRKILVVRQRIARIMTELTAKNAQKKAA